MEDKIAKAKELVERHSENPHFEYFFELYKRGMLDIDGFITVLKKLG